MPVHADNAASASTLLRTPEQWGLPAWVTVLLVLLVVTAGVLAIHAAVFSILLRIYGKAERAASSRRRTMYYQNVGTFIRAARVPTAVASATGAAFVVMQSVAGIEEQHLFSAAIDEAVADVLLVGLVIAVTAIASNLVAATISVALGHFDVDQADNREARALHTQWRVIGRIAIVVIWIVGVAAALMTFEAVRSLGQGLLASAGIGALIIGLAAQRSLGNFLAGVQIALTQPFRLDDVVVVKGEWGRIEEITTTYVVVRIWDARRLIVPFSTLLEEPFENWTRTTAELLGTVFLSVDYDADLDAIRQTLKKFCEGHEKWDGRVCAIVVTDADREGLQIRALVSAADSSKAWDLRCDVREHLVRYLQREQPQALPRTRVALTDDPNEDSSDAKADLPPHTLAP